MQLQKTNINLYYNQNFIKLILHALFWRTFLFEFYAFNDSIKHILLKDSKWYGKYQHNLYAIFKSESKMIEVKFKNKTYKIKKEKIKKVLSKLEPTNKNIEIIELMKQYKLFDEIFLENINKL